VIRPIRRLEEPFSRPKIIVIDVLDECEDETLVGELMSVIVESLRDFEVSLKLLITSRPEPYLCNVFEREVIEAQARSISLADTDTQLNIRVFL
jgi:hypothetical protein